MSEWMPDRVPHRLSDRMSEKMPDSIPEWLSARINLCLRGGLGWWFGSLGIDGFVNLEKTKNIKPCKQ